MFSTEFLFLNIRLMKYLRGRSKLKYVSAKDDEYGGGGSIFHPKELIFSWVCRLRPCIFMLEINFLLTKAGCFQRNILFSLGNCRKYTSYSNIPVFYYLIMTTLFIFHQTQSKDFYKLNLCLGIIFSVKKQNTFFITYNNMMLKWKTDIPS